MESADPGNGRGRVHSEHIRSAYSSHRSILNFWAQAIKVPHSKIFQIGKEANLIRMKRVLARKLAHIIGKMTAALPTAYIVPAALHCRPQYR